MLQSTRKKRNKGWLYPVVTVTLVTQGGVGGGSPVLPLQSVTNWGGAKKLALQSVTKGGVTALSEGYVIYGRSLMCNDLKTICIYLKCLVVRTTSTPR